MNKKLGIIVQTNFSKLQKNFLVRFFYLLFVFFLFLVFFQNNCCRLRRPDNFLLASVIQNGKHCFEYFNFFINLLEKIKKVITRNKVIGLLVNHFKDHLIVTRKTISTGFVPCEKKIFFSIRSTLCFLTLWSVKLLFLMPSKIQWNFWIINELIQKIEWTPVRKFKGYPKSNHWKLKDFSKLTKITRLTYNKLDKEIGSRDLKKMTLWSFCSPAQRLG